MRFMKPVSRRLLVAYGIVLAAIAAAGIVPWTVVAAEAPQAALSPAAGKAPAAAKADKSVPVEQKEDVAPKPAEVDQQGKTGRGRFVSFENGTLKLYARPGVTMVWNKLPENSKTVRFDRDAGMFQPVDDAAAALKQVEPGTWVQVIVGSGNATIRINERKQYTTGTFVSFKEDRLLLMMKVLVPTSYTKKYGNQVHFNTFYDDTPIYESVDGGEYELIGTANKVLRSVKEGTILTVHGEGDDNITLIQIGVAKKK